MKKLNAVFLVISIITTLIYCPVAFSQESTERSSLVEVSEWLQLGPFQTALPAFDNGNVKLSDLLAFQEMDVSNWWPWEKENVNLNRNQELRWNKVSAAGGEIGLAKSDSPHIVYLASYLSVNRFVRADIKAISPHLFQMYLDGVVIRTKSSSEKPEDKDESASEIKQTIKLETGKHLLLIKALSDPENNSDWKIKVSLEVSAEFGENPVSISLSPEQIMSIHRLLDGPKITGVSISPDGEFMTISYSQTQPPTDNVETWIEILKTSDNRLVQTLRGGFKVANVKWSSQKGVFAYTKADGDKTDLWIINLASGKNFPVLKEVKDFEEYNWSPDGSFIIYSITEKPDNKDAKVKRWRSLRDRWPYFRDRSFLYQVSVPEGVQQRLSAGDLTTQLLDISPDGKRLLVTQYTDDYDDRPYTQDFLFIMDLASMKVDTLWKGEWLKGGQWSPDGRSLLLLGGPSLFGETGRNVSSGKIPNEEDNQAYLFQIATKNVTPITREFKPSIDDAIWPHQGQFVYFNTTDQLENNLYRFDLKSKKFERIDIGMESLKEISVADEQPIGVYFGSSAAEPPKTFKINLNTRKYEQISDPGEADFRNVIFGKVEDWRYQTSAGAEIEGTIYYPPYFDPNKTYPCIIYYYGGVSPTTKTFGGRYPKNLFVAQGYVLYTMSPSGAVGFGQDFSAMHSNDWGKVVSGEIIEGTKKFLKAHPFVDSTRVGCIGASYGGFMTMLLLSQTDIFAAGISHAGISSISSYWGEGYWGYWYNSISAPNSFPWNRPDIYVGQSALFHADKINTPLLLLHGSADTNVPPGESTQLYTALKLLGKEVEYVQVYDQDHWILNYGKRIVWENTILAWFDKWLKDQPQWWNDLYSEK
jgi:dipeptidyl aminopeptidase/acylaminoacyl peptidase